MTLLGTLSILGGLFGLIATRLGWYDAGGVMRRLDWFGVYDLLDHSWVGGGIRRANYAISAVLLVLGAVALFGAA